MIQWYKIFKGIVWIDVEGMIQPAITRSHTFGHQLRILRQQTHHRARANAFSQRVMEEWNSLPIEVVNASSVDDFKPSKRSWTYNGYIGNMKRLLHKRWVLSLQAWPCFACKEYIILFRIKRWLIESLKLWPNFDLRSFFIPSVFQTQWDMLIDIACYTIP